MSATNDDAETSATTSASPHSHSAAARPQSAHRHRSVSWSDQLAASTLHQMATSPPALSTAPSPAPAAQGPHSWSPVSEQSSHWSPHPDSIARRPSNSALPPLRMATADSIESDELSAEPGGASESTATTSTAAAAAAAANKKKNVSKRKKASRACFHCQKCHLTCDDVRPCNRCVKKGLADSCTDGVRKKAKYLLDDEELQALQEEKARKAANKAGAKQASAGAIASSSKSKVQAVSKVPARAQVKVLEKDELEEDAVGASPAVPQPGEAARGGTYATSAQPFGDLAPATAHAASGFGSEATSLEYHILSSMLSDIDPSLLGPGTTTGSSGGSAAGGTPDMETTRGSLMDGDSYPTQGGYEGFSSALQTHPQHALRPQGTYGEDATRRHGQNLLPIETLGSASGSGSGSGSAPDPNASNDMSQASSELVWKERVARVYRDQTRPFRYTEGYHFLLKFCTENFQKADVLRIVRALAIFRPSLIALQMPLTEDDEIFVERSLQRTVLELEKLVALSGTPTVVWRRTCEICVVGAEFAMLTQWSREHLVGSYIYQFFDKESTLDYWETFALHAFDAGRQSVVVKCALVTPTGRRVPCSACFSIKRDIFDLPSLVVGNFLPILS